jgi:hypothetical protein
MPLTQHNSEMEMQCNFGILNYYLGKRAADEGRDSRYPDIDFCKDPGAICHREDHEELKWIAGFFYWVRTTVMFKADVDALISLMKHTSSLVFVSHW